jgi:creatinine amidohydrolase
VRQATVALETLTWPEVDALLAAGVRTAVIPLGSTEQHGPHLPFATDTWIADTLATRLCARLGDAIRCPTLPLGCSTEHLGFAGTLDVTPATLQALLADVLRSLARHGFARAFIFSAHGGNYAALAEAQPALQAAAAPMHVSVFTDLERVSALFHRVGAELGVDAGASGHHAGEFETSVMLAIRAAAVRTDRLEAGLVTATNDAQSLFYPTLRANAPHGVVGDPRAASAARAERYLSVWVELLAAAYRRENASA